MIDTGVNGDVAARSINLTDDSDGDANGHGTRMAQAISQASDGHAVILSIKAFNDDGTASLANVYAAVKYAIEAKADIINISASVPDSANTAALRNMIIEAMNNGISVVVAAGNAHADASGFFPANVEGVIAVGAVTEEGTLVETSNYGDCVKLYVLAGSTPSFSAAAVLASAAHPQNASRDPITASLPITCFISAFLLPSMWKHMKAMICCKYNCIIASSAACRIDCFGKMQALTLVHVAQFGKQIFQDETAVDAFVYTDRTIAAGMNIIHLFVEDRCRPAFPFAAVIEQNDADGRRIAEPAMLLWTLHTGIIECHDIFHEILPKFPARIDLVIKLCERYRHHAVHIARHLPETYIRFKDDIGGIDIVFEVVFPPS